MTSFLTLRQLSYVSSHLYSCYSSASYSQRPIPSLWPFTSGTRTGPRAATPPTWDGQKQDCGALDTAAVGREQAGVTAEAALQRDPQTQEQQRLSQQVKPGPSEFCFLNMACVQWTALVYHRCLCRIQGTHLWTILLISRGGVDLDFTSLSGDYCAL